MSLYMRQGVHLCYKVVDAVHSQVECCEARCEETSPPPVVILHIKDEAITDNISWRCLYLCTQVEIAEQDCSFGAGDNQDDENEEEEAVPDDNDEDREDDKGGSW